MRSALRIWRRLPIMEDAAESGELSAPIPDAEPYVDAMEHKVRFRRVRAEWWCDGCGTRNEGWRDACAYCGTVRDDIECE